MHFAPNYLKSRENFYSSNEETKILRSVQSRHEFESQIGGNIDFEEVYGKAC